MTLSDAAGRSRLLGGRGRPVPLAVGVPAECSCGLELSAPSAACWNVPLVKTPISVWQPGTLESPGARLEASPAPVVLDDGAAVRQHTEHVGRGVDRHVEPVGQLLGVVGLAGAA